MKCEICPRECGADRVEKFGFCGCGETLRIAKIMVHRGEEPVISGKNGSGAIFFSGCVLKCPFCQNYPVSHEHFGRDITDEQLSEEILALQEKNVHNINLVTPTQYLHRLIPILEKLKPRLKIPVVMNTGGYEKAETIRRLDGLIDIYLPDLKYYSSELSAKYSAAPDYFEQASAALEEMLRQQPKAKIYDGIMKKGVIVRHLVLPGCYKDSMKLIEWLSILPNRPLLSVMRQYTPCYKAADFPELNRRITTFEYRKVTDFCAELGFDGFTQEKGCETLDMTPVWEE